MPTLTLTKSPLISLLIKNRDEQKNAKYSNDILIQMLTHSSIQSISVESTKGNDEMVNRGSVCETIIKCEVQQFLNAYKTSKNADITRGVGETRKNFRELGLNPNHKYEVKFNTSFALAHDCPIKTKQVILVVKEGIYLVESQDYQRANRPQGVRLDELSERLGFKGE